MSDEVYIHPRYIWDKKYIAHSVYYHCVLDYAVCIVVQMTNLHLEEGNTTMHKTVYFEPKDIGC